MLRSMYEGKANDDLSGRMKRAVSDLFSLARVGMAASDTTLNLDLHKGGYTDLFGLMAGIADNMFDDLDKLERAAGIGTVCQHNGQATPVAVYAEWQAQRAAQAALADAVAEGQDNPPELDAVEAQVEATGAKLAAMKPTTHADAVAMLEWAEVDSGGDCLSPQHTQARAAVVAYLQERDRYTRK